MEYTVLSNFDNSMDGATEKLKKRVELYLTMGWKLQGGVSISISSIPGMTIDRYYHLAQAMVKED